MADRGLAPVHDELAADRADARRRGREPDRHADEHGLLRYEHDLRGGDGLSCSAPRPFARGGPISDERTTCELAESGVYGARRMPLYGFFDAKPMSAPANETVASSIARLVVALSCCASERACASAACRGQLAPRVPPRTCASSRARCAPSSKPEPSSSYASTSMRA